MNLYLLTRTDNVGYDEFDSFVIAANTEEEALALKRPEPDDNYPTWAQDKDVEVKLIGTTTEYTEPTDILGSFNAG
jgi:hypothetical protein